MFQEFPARFPPDLGYLNDIMADRKQSREFLGGGPKFNQVGRDTRGLNDAEEPVIPLSRTGYWIKVSIVGAVVLALAVTLFVLNDQNLGKTTLPPNRIGGHSVSPESKDAPPPPSLQ